MSRGKQGFFGEFVSALYQWSKPAPGELRFGDSMAVLASRGRAQRTPRSRRQRVDAAASLLLAGKWHMAPLTAAMLVFAVAKMMGTPPFHPATLVVALGSGAAAGAVLKRRGMFVQEQERLHSKVQAAPLRRHEGERLSPRAAEMKRSGDLVREAVRAWPRVSDVTAWAAFEHGRVVPAQLVPSQGTRTCVLSVRTPERFLTASGAEAALRDAPVLAREYVKVLSRSVAPELVKGLRVTVSPGASPEQMTVELVFPGSVEMLPDEDAPGKSKPKQKAKR